MSDGIDQIATLPAAASPVAPGTLDRAGKPFDPALHIPKQSGKTGRWMPRGGRKPKAVSAASSSSPPASLFPEDSPPSPSPSSPPEAAPSFADIEKAAAAGAPPAPTPGAAAAPAGDAAMPAEASAEIAVRALYAVTGVAIGDHKAATAGPAEHKNLIGVATAYIRHRGWAMVGLVAVLGTLLAYLLQDGRREPIADRLKKLIQSMRKKPVNVTPVSETIDIAPAETVAPSSPAAPVMVEKF